MADLDQEVLAKALFEWRFPQYGEDGLNSVTGDGGDWWKDKCSEGARLISERVSRG